MNQDEAEIPKHVEGLYEQVKPKKIGECEFTIEFKELSDNSPQRAFMQEWLDRINAKPDPDAPRISRDDNGNINIEVKDIEEAKDILNRLKIEGFKITKPESKTCECEIPYFPTGDIHWCSKCNKETIY